MKLTKKRHSARGTVDTPLPSGFCWGVLLDTAKDEQVHKDFWPDHFDICQISTPITSANFELQSPCMIKTPAADAVFGIQAKACYRDYLGCVVV